jgi:hypothetical protein
MDRSYIDVGGRTASKGIALLLVVLSLVGYKIWKRQVRRRVRVSESFRRTVADMW